MLSSHLGAAKNWFYAAWFKPWPVSPASLRVSMLLAGAISIWVFYRLVRRIAGNRAGLAGVALPASDPVYRLVTLWNRIISHHLLPASVKLCFLRIHHSRIRSRLAAGGFWAGLAVWDKALFAWLLVALIAGSLAAFPRAVRGSLSWRNFRIAAVWFVVGTSPLLLSNLRSRGEIIRDNARMSLAELRTKADVLWHSWDGSILFDWILTDQAPPAPRI